MLDVAFQLRGIIVRFLDPRAEEGGEEVLLHVFSGIGMQSGQHVLQFVGDFSARGLVEDVDPHCHPFPVG